MSEQCTEFLLSILPDRVGETGVECEIILPDYCPNILRILQSSAIPRIRSCLQNGDKMTVEGSVEFRILYLPEEGGSVRAVAQQTSFAVTVDCREEGEWRAEITRATCTARALNSKKIHVRSTLQIKGTGDGCRTLPTPELPEDFQQKTRKSKGAVRLCGGEKPLRISDEFEMEPGKRVGEILQSKVTFRQTEEKILTDKLIVKADMIFDLLCAAEDGTVFGTKKVLPVSQILDLPGISAEGVCRTGMELISCNLTPREEGADGTQTVGYEVEIRVYAGVYKVVETCRIEDAYSVKNTAECTKERVFTESFLPIEESGAIREATEIGTCTGILWGDATPQLQNFRRREEDGKVVCDGVWDCRLLLQDADGTPGAVNKEIPFTLELPEGCNTPVRNDTDLILTDIVFTQTDTTHVELRGNYRWKGIVFIREEGEAVTGVTVTGPRKKPEETLTLFFARRGESAWEIAKELGCDYQDTVKNNSLPGDAVQEDMMLMIFR